MLETGKGGDGVEVTERGKKRRRQKENRGSSGKRVRNARSRAQAGKGDDDEQNEKAEKGYQAGIHSSLGMKNWLKSTRMGIPTWVKKNITWPIS